MVDRPRLALAIPTYRRPGNVADNLAQMMDEARELGIPIYLSDDSPDAETEAVVKAAVRRYHHIYYRRNDPALGHDANLISTLCWANADYVWLLGDALRVKPGCLRRIAAFIDEQDMLFVNSHSDDTGMITAVRGEEALPFIRDTLWHQTMTGATIFHRRVCDWVLSQGSAMTIKRNFPQLSIVLGYASANPVTIGWFGEPSIQSGKKQSYWNDRAVSVFVDDWVALVTAFPEVIPPKFRIGVIRSHSARTKLFGAWKLIELKPSGQFSWSSLSRPHFLDAMHLPAWKVIGLIALPMSAVSAARYMKRGVFRLANKMRRGLSR